MFNAENEGILVGKFTEKADGVSLGIVALSILENCIGHWAEIFIFAVTNMFASHVLAREGLNGDAKSLRRAIIPGVGVNELRTDYLIDDNVIVPEAV